MPLHEVRLRDMRIGGDQLVVIAGPCVIEDDPAVIFQAAERLKAITSALGVP